LPPLESSGPASSETDHRLQAAPILAPPGPATDEQKRIQDALEQCAGNQTRAAKLLGISRRSLVMKLTKYGMPRPRKRSSTDES
jgi:DNA-binding NtrC family response regulator